MVYRTVANSTVAKSVGVIQLYVHGRVAGKFSIHKITRNSELCGCENFCFFSQLQVLKRWIAADFLPLRRAELEDVVRMLMYFIISVVAGVEECKGILRFLRQMIFLFPSK